MTDTRPASEFNPSLMFIALFAILRPVFVLSFAAQYDILGMNLLKLFGTGFSIIFIIIALIHLKNFRLDGINLSILLYCAYSLLSILWGSSLEGIAEQVFPFTVFFAVRLTQPDQKQIYVIIMLMLIGYIVPVLGSSFLIMTGKTLYKTIYWTELQRYSGLYLKIHTMAHSMFLFIVCLSVYYYYHEYFEVDNKIFLYLIVITAAFSIFNIYKSFTRTVYVGFFSYLMIYLTGRRKYIPLLISFLAILVIMITTDKFQIIFFDVYDYLLGLQPIETVGSGRIGMWTRTLNEYANFDFERKFLGFGLGGIYAGHNDILSLLITSGIMGVFLYFAVLVFLFYELSMSNVSRDLKFIYLGFSIAVFLMNFLSNSYLSRFETQQIFLFLIGIFFAVIDQSTEKVSAPILVNV